MNTPVVTHKFAVAARGIRWHTIGVIVVILVFVEYGGFFIYRTSVEVDGVRTYSLFDDAMISMRYAKNLAAGDGLVWNPGDTPVEGYTNFLWTLVMAGVHLLPVTTANISLLIQVLSLVLLVLNLLLVRKVALLVSHGSHGVALASIALTAFYFPLNNWALQGMEVGILATMVTALVLILLQNKGSIPATWLGMSLLAAIVLTRADAVVLVLGLVLLGWSLWRHESTPNPWKAVAIALGVFVLHSIFRLLYYDDILPNTYHLKVAGIPIGDRLVRGLETFWSFVSEGSLFLILLPFLLLILAPQQRKITVLMLGAFAIQSVYSIYVGGDAWEWYGGANRYVAVVMPVFFILLCWTVHEVLIRLKNELMVRWRSRPLDIRPALFACVVAFAFHAFNGMHWVSLTLQVAPLEVHNNVRMVRNARFIREVTEPHARVAVVWAGIIPYFSERVGVDLLGKNDKHIARLSAQPAREFVPGHNKWDYAYSIINDPPDVVAQLWKEMEEVMPFLEKEYTAVLRDDGRAIYFKKGSRFVRFEVLHGITQE